MLATTRCRHPAPVKRRQSESALDATGTEAREMSSDKTMESTSYPRVVIGIVKVIAFFPTTSPG